MPEMNNILPSLSYWPADPAEPVLDISIGDALRAAASTWRTRTALIDGTSEEQTRRRWTFEELLTESEMWRELPLTSGSAIRRLSGAGSLRRSGSIRSNCSAGPRSRISAVQTRNAAATAPGLLAQARPPGTEFLDAETGRQKSSTNARTPTETKIQELSTRKQAFATFELVTIMGITHKLR